MAEMPKHWRPIYFVNDLKKKKLLFPEC